MMTMSRGLQGQNSRMKECGKQVVGEMITVTILGCQEDMLGTEGHFINKFSIFYIKNRVNILCLSACTRLVCVHALNSV